MKYNNEETIIASVEYTTNSQILNNLILAHERLSNNCNHKSVTALIKLSKFICLFSEKCNDREVIP